MLAIVHSPLGADSTNPHSSRSRLLDIRGLGGYRSPNLMQCCGIGQLPSGPRYTRIPIRRAPFISFKNGTQAPATRFPPKMGRRKSFWWDGHPTKKSCAAATFQ